MSPFSLVRPLPPFIVIAASRNEPVASVPMAKSGLLLAKSSVMTVASPPPVVVRLPAPERTEYGGAFQLTGSVQLAEPAGKQTTYGSAAVPAVVTAESSACTVAA